MGEADVVVRVDQDLCTGDGLCVQLAPAVFEFDVDGLAYVKEPGSDDLLTAAGATVVVPERCLKDVVEAAEGCPGDCIFVTRADGTVLAGPAH